MVVVLTAANQLGVTLEGVSVALALEGPVVASEERLMNPAWDIPPEVIIASLFDLFPSCLPFYYCSLPLLLMFPLVVAFEKCCTLLLSSFGT